jgi:hypothetical protein
MRTPSKLVLLALAKSMVFSLAVSSASARRIEVSNQNFLAIWTSLRFASGALGVNCKVTLEGSFHSRTLSKVSGQLIGYVTEAEVAGEMCTGGSATVLRENLPWHVRYSSFTGTLPNITGIRIQLIGARFAVELGIECLATTTAAAPAFGLITIASGVAREIRAEGTIPCIERLGGSVNGTFSGTGEVFLQTPLGRGLISTRINVRLVQ